MNAFISCGTRVNTIKVGCSTNEKTIDHLFMYVKKILIEKRLNFYICMFIFFLLEKVIFMKNLVREDCK